MSVATKKKRPIVVEGERFYWRAGGYYAPLRVVAEDRSLLLEWRTGERGPARVWVSGEHPAIAAFLDGAGFAVMTLPDAFGDPRVEPNRPSTVAALLRYVLDPRLEKTRFDPYGVARPQPVEPAGWPLPGRPRREAVRRAVKQHLGRLPADCVAAQLTLGSVASQRRAVSAVWEALAARGVVPQAWCDGAGPRTLLPDGLRLEGDEPSGRAGTGYLGWGATRGPATLVALRCLAEDPEGVARAEALARELCARLAPWFDDGAAASARAPVRWLALADEGGPAWRWDESPSCFALRGAPAASVGEAGYFGLAAVRSEVLDAESGENSGGESGGASGGVGGGALDEGDPASTLPRAVDEAERFARAWASACARDAQVRATWPHRAALQGVAYRALPDPSAPLLDVARAGYAVLSLDARGVVLAATLARRGVR